MAKIINIVTHSFDDASCETTTYGICSNCGEKIFSQWIHGFPKKCPKCKLELENGTDGRELMDDSLKG